MTLNVLSLFSGIGGLDLGLETAGMTCVGQVEADEFCRRVLARHWRGIPRHDDVRTAAGWWLGEPRPPVHVVAGGPPCQPVSDAGRKMAQQDPRWLWPAMLDVVTAVRPQWVVVENVPGLRTRGLGAVLADLAAAGYATRTGEVSACAMGAPHPRRRLFILAHTQGPGRCPWRAGTARPVPPAGQQPPGHRPQRRGWWATEPNLDRVAYGVPGGVDRRRALGNAVVPQVAEAIGRLITAREAS